MTDSQPMEHLYCYSWSTTDDQSASGTLILLQLIHNWHPVSWLTSLQSLYVTFVLMLWTYEVQPFVHAGRSTYSVCVLCPYVLIAGRKLILVRRYWFVVYVTTLSACTEHWYAEPSFCYVFIRRYSAIGPGPPQYRGLTITLRHTTLSRIPLDEGSARRTGLYLTTHNIYDRHPCPQWDSNWQTHQTNGHQVRHSSVALQPPPPPPWLRPRCIGTVMSRTQS